jgi:hypothetical protein
VPVTEWLIHGVVTSYIECLHWFVCNQRENIVFCLFLAKHVVICSVVMTLEHGWVMALCSQLQYIQSLSASQISLEIYISMICYLAPLGLGHGCLDTSSINILSFCESSLFFDWNHHSLLLAYCSVLPFLYDLLLSVSCDIISDYCYILELI